MCLSWVRHHVKYDGKAGMSESLGFGDQSRQLISSQGDKCTACSSAKYKAEWNQSGKEAHGWFSCRDLELGMIHLDPGRPERIATSELDCEEHYN